MKSTSTQRFNESLVYPSISNNNSNSLSSRRNYMSSSVRNDQLIEWMKELLNHSFVLNSKESYHGTMLYFEELIEEYRKHPDRSRLKQFVPNVGKFHTDLKLGKAFEEYNRKYSISSRRHIAPSFNEIRHILNLAQVMAIGKNLQLITFDGDQTLYSDGGNFEDDEGLSVGIVTLLRHGCRVAVITAAGYGLDGSKYELRLKGLLDKFVEEKLTEEQINGLFVFGGECNYLLRAKLVQNCVNLIPVAVEDWQADDLHFKNKPSQWSEDDIKVLLDIVEKSFRETIDELKLRAKVIRKERAVGVIPGGYEMSMKVPFGHGSKKLKREALDELVLRAMDAIRVYEPFISLPYCVFNGGRDAWLDVGNKSVAVEALKAYLKLEPHHCLHVGDQVIQRSLALIDDRLILFL